ncbi:initiator replication protein RepB [Klebsiella pneumoniae]|uniref:Initiator replication protein RepB n=1 Tax=Klebsiella pneumoniae TaxID=573 RepID=A0A2X3BKL2_KLEPN|nr:initiator replication protein RepB [Klebsiella pneumoniae]
MAGRLTLAFIIAIPKLISGTVKVPRKEEEEKAPEQNYDEVIKALKAAGIDPQKLAEALSAMKPEN